jgi:hypothetical protein
MSKQNNFFERFWSYITEFIKQMKIVLAVFVTSLLFFQAMNVFGHFLRLTKRKLITTVAATNAIVPIIIG